MGVTHHANYLAFFEMGRVEALRQLGIEYRSLVDRGMHITVVEATVRYQQPTFFDDLLLVVTHATNIGRARFTFSYEVQRASDLALVASGHTVHACVDAESLRPVRLPAELLDALRQLRQESSLRGVPLSRVEGNRDALTS